MSKLIKPDDTPAFQSAAKFEKEPFRLGSKSAPEQVVLDSSRLHVDLVLPGLQDAGLDQLTAKAQEAADDIIQEAEANAAEILSEAKDRAEDIFRQARERGRSDGAEEVRGQAERQHQASARMLSSFIEQMKKRETELAQSLAPRLADLATELASKIIHREVGADSSLVARQAEQAIYKILERDKLVIRVNPSDEKLMKEHKPTLLEMFDGTDKIEVIGDPEVERGGCIVETDLIKIDAQPRAQLNAARNAFSDETER